LHIAAVLDSGEALANLLTFDDCDWNAGNFEKDTPLQCECLRLSFVNNNFAVMVQDQKGARVYIRLQC
jgi:hypothetical protein